MYEEEEHHQQHQEEDECGCGHGGRHSHGRHHERGWGEQSERGHYHHRHEGECGCGHHGRHHRHHEGGCGCGHHDRPHHQGGECGCEGRDGGATFRRRFQTREERVAWLHKYLKDLQAEAQAVEERIAKLSAEG